jgi:hypothetical protein
MGDGLRQLRIGQRRQHTYIPARAKRIGEHTHWPPQLERPVWASVRYRRDQIEVDPLGEQPEKA